MPRDDERSQPPVGSFHPGVAEAIRERGDSPFYLTRYGSDAGVFAVLFAAELEAVPATGRVQRRRATDEDVASSTPYFSRSSAKNAWEEHIDAGGFDLRVQEIVRIEIGGSREPAILSSGRITVPSTATSGVVPLRAGRRLRGPVVNDRSSSPDAEYTGNRDSIRKR